MDSFELNKILGAILATCILVLLTSFAANAVFTPKAPVKPGFEIAAKEESHGGGGAAAAAPSEPIEKLLQTASVEKGTAAAKKCAACHHPSFSLSRLRSDRASRLTALVRHLRPNVIDNYLDRLVERYPESPGQLSLDLLKPLPELLQTLDIDRVSHGSPP